MSTRSRIGYTNNGYVHSAYHHCDGSPEVLGRYLVKHFNTKAKVEALVAGGDMSNCLDSDGDVSKVLYYATRSNWNDPRGGTCESWEDVKPQVDDCVETYSEEMLPENLKYEKTGPSMIAYMYSYMRGKYPKYDGEWYVSDNGIDWEKVEDEIAYQERNKLKESA